MYIAKVLDQFEYSPNGWKGARVGVFKIEAEEEIQVGEYQRNLGSFYETFFPFERNGQQLALYSPDYTATRILRLPSCEDLGGEEPASMGFCPVEYFVPTYFDQEVIQRTNNKSFPDETISKERINNPTPDLIKEWSSQSSYVNGVTGQECEDVMSYRPLTPLTFYPFGFVAGCVWADDSSWKIQMLDLAEADKGILKREEVFGYIELPEDQSLKEAIDMGSYGYDTEYDYKHYIRINVRQTFDVRTGRVVNPFE